MILSVTSIQHCRRLHRVAPWDTRRTSPRTRARQPLLCAVCREGFFRSGPHRCESCDDTLVGMPGYIAAACLLAMLCGSGLATFMYGKLAKMNRRHDHVEFGELSRCSTDAQEEKSAAAGAAAAAAAGFTTAGSVDGPAARPSGRRCSALWDMFASAQKRKHVTRASCGGVVSAACTVCAGAGGRLAEQRHGPVRRPLAPLSATVCNLNAPCTKTQKLSIKSLKVKASRVWPRRSVLVSALNATEGFRC